MLRPDSLAFTVLLAFLMSFGPLSIDLFLPSMPEIGRSLGAPAAQLQFTISLYLAAFAVGQIVYVAFSHDTETMGFGFPKELRDALVQSEPHKFSLPSQSDMRFNWVDVRLAAIDADEMCDLVEGAWAMCVPKRVAAEYAASRGYPVER